MANTYTPTYNLLKPEVGADTNAWGTHLNNDLDTIDTHMVSRALTTAQTLAGAINLPSNGLNVGSGQLRVTGGNVTMSGTLTATGAATLSSTLTVGSTTTLQAGLNVTGATALSSTLSVTGATTLAANGLNVGSGQLNVTGGNVAMSGNLTVTGSITTGANTASSLSVSGSSALTTLSVSGTSALTGATTMVGNLTIQSGSSERSITLGSTGGYFFGNSTTNGWKDSAGNAKVSWDTSGNFTAAQNITAYSDARLKQNVMTIDNPFDYINRMRGVWYRRIEDDKAGTGVIAQEVQAVIPELVHEHDGMLSVAYGNFAGVFIEALKILDARLSKVEAA